MKSKNQNKKQNKERFKTSFLHFKTHHKNMFRRSTIGKNSSSLKQRQLSHLHSQLAQLEANLSDFENLIKITTFQAEYIKKLGIMHGSL